jgi:hypothetical protein
MRKLSIAVVGILLASILITENSGAQQTRLGQLESRADFKVVTLDDVLRFRANPFAWKGKALFFVGRFLEMLTEDSGVFEISPQEHTPDAYPIGIEGLVMVTGMAARRFTGPGDAFGLVVRVDAVKEVHLWTRTVRLPSVRFVSGLRVSSGQDEGTIAALRSAIRLYHERHGRFPKDVDEAMTHVSGALPWECRGLKLRYSNVTGKLEIASAGECE